MLDKRAHPRVRAAIARLGLTRRQGEIVEALSLGLRHDALAQALDISRSTLRSHFRHIFGALNVGNRVELLAMVLNEVVRDVDQGGLELTPGRVGQARLLGEPHEADGRRAAGVKSQPS